MAMSLFGSTKIKRHTSDGQSVEIDLKGPYRRISIVSYLKEKHDFDITPFNHPGNYGIYGEREKKKD